MALVLAGRALTKASRVKRPVQPNNDHANLLALLSQILDRFARSISTGTHQDDDALGIRCAEVVEQMVLSAGQRGELIHGFLNNAGAGVVVRVGAFTGLEEYVRILGGAANKRMVRRQATVAVGLDEVVVDHGPQHTVVQRSRSC